MREALFRPGTDADIDQVSELLHQHMNRKVTADVFRRLMAYDWAGEKPHIGMVVEADGQIVGFHGNVYSTRFLPDGARVMGSFTSLYIHKDWRGENLGYRMMHTYEDRPDITYTVFDPSKRVHGILEECGFRDLDLNRYLWAPGGNGDRGGDVELIQDADRISPLISDEEQRYLHDHRDLRAYPVLIRGNSGDVLTFWLRQDRGDKGFCHDLIYTGDPVKLAAMIDAAAPGIMGGDPRARVLADERFFDGNPVGGRREPLAYRRMVRRADPALPDWRVDHLYTETLLIDLKLG